MVGPLTTFGTGTYGSGTFGDPRIILTFTDTASVSDAAQLARSVRYSDTSTAADTSRAGLVRAISDGAGSGDTRRFGSTRRIGTDLAGSTDDTLTAILRTLLDEAGAIDVLHLDRGQRLVEAADSAGADDTVTRIIHRRWVLAERAGARDMLSLNGVPAPVSVFTAWAGTELGADRIVIRDAPLVVNARHGNRTRDWDQAGAVTADGCSVQPYGAAEVVADREFTATHLRLFAPPGTALAATSRVIFDGTTYEVDGEPATWRDLDGRPSHIEAALKRLSG